MGTTTDDDDATDDGRSAVVGRSTTDAKQKIIIIVIIIMFSCGTSGVNLCYYNQHTLIILYSTASNWSYNNNYYF